jgi:small-conductance mechanosensitive channel
MRPCPDDRRKDKSSSLLSAEQAGDALDAFSLDSGLIAAEPAQLQPPTVGCSVSQKTVSSSAAARHAVPERASAAAAAAVEENAEELRHLRGECRQQALDLQALRRQLDESTSQLETAQADARHAQAVERRLHETLNMQRFKYELLLDLVKQAAPFRPAQRSRRAHLHIEEGGWLGHYLVEP